MSRERGLDLSAQDVLNSYIGKPYTSRDKGENLLSSFVHFQVLGDRDFFAAAEKTLPQVTRCGWNTSRVTPQALHVGY